MRSLSSVFHSLARPLLSAVGFATLFASGGAAAESRPVAIGFNLVAPSTPGMSPGDLAGPPGARFANWNNVALGGSAPFTAIIDSNGGAVVGMSATIAPGNAGSMIVRNDAGRENDGVLFSALLDKFDGREAVVSVSGIPYENYDVYFYMADDGDRRGGSFTVGDTTYHLRGGVGAPKTDGGGYVLSTDTTYAAGTNTQANYVKFTGLSGPLKATFTAREQGDKVQRLKFAGFQIVGSAVPAKTPPPAPASATITAVTGGYAVNWAPVAGASSYQVFRATKRGAYDPNKPLATVAAPASGFSDTKAGSAASAFYRVRAVNAVGAGGLSEEIGNPPPNLDSVAVSSPVIWPGGETTLSWNVPNADTITVSDGARSLTRPASGSLTVSPAASTNYDFKATNAFGTATKRLTVDVVPKRDTRDTVWQWSVTLPGFVSAETKDHPRAFLYIPPNVSRVRGVLIGQHNMLEEPMLEHKAVRAGLAEAGMAAIWVTPAFDRNFNFTGNPATPKIFQDMMDDLAKASGYAELSKAPVVFIGHSAMAESPYFFAVWDAQNSAKTGAPRRCAAAISVKGWFPGKHDETTPTYADSDLAGTPLMYIEGEGADAKGRAGGALNFRNKTPGVIMSYFVDIGGGHFDWNDKVCDYVGLYLRKLGRHRLPATAQPDGTANLLPIDPAKQGWLGDRWRPGQAPGVPVASVANYTGNRAEAFWFFDEEHAKASQKDYELTGKNRGQLATFTRDGEVIAQRETHMQIEEPVVPDPAGDGLTFKLGTTFLDTVPAVSSRLAGWAGAPAGSPVGHAEGGGPILIERICGPVEQLSPDTFRIKFDHVGTENIYGQTRSRDICLMAVHPGDANYKRAVQQALFRVNLPLTAGADQAITFPPIPDQRRGAKSVALAATTSGVATYPAAKVDYYVLEGPARLNGSTLEFTEIPPRAKFPVKVTVVATQYGRGIPPLMKTATPVSRTFYINAP